ncbi:DUF2840 domain-containing protein [Devosia faecipullorum]
MLGDLAVILVPSSDDETKTLLKAQPSICAMGADGEQGSVFAFVRWASGDHGTVVSRIDVVRAIGRGEPFQTLPFVRPGGEILLRLDGWPKVQRALAAIDAVESLGLDPADASPEHWRHVHNRLTANLEPHAYTPERHAAWLHRRRIGP